MTVDPRIEYPIGYLDSGTDEDIVALEEIDEEIVVEDNTSEDIGVEMLETPTSDISKWYEEARTDASGRTVIDLYVDVESDISLINYEFRVTAV